MNSIHAGHYVSVVKNYYDNKWYLFDDANAVILCDEHNIQSKNAYLLFYIRND